MINLRSKDKCCGCSACENICSFGAIEMVEDNEGFFYPQLDNSLCVSCDKCNSVCPFETPKLNENIIKVYGLKHKQLDERINSRSGGAFVGFADEILNKNGVVYGAALQENFLVKHIRATTFKDRKKIQKAKYIQSNTRHIYENVLCDLNRDLDVLFTGTPCQVSALKLFLERKRADTTKLICCDIICLGVPSPKIWNDYLRYIESKYKTQIYEVNFRDKEFGWDSHFESFGLQGKKEKVVTNNFSTLFSKHLILRPSCHNCPYSSVNRIGDITMADFWGIDKTNPTFNDNLGVSLILVNSKKGLNLLNQITDSFDMFETEIENAMQQSLISPCQPALNRDEFWNEYETITFKALLKKYTTPSSKSERIKKSIKQLLYFSGIRKHP